MTLRQKLALPSPQWLLIALSALLIIGVVKVLMWIVPLLVAASAKVLMWIIPLAWKVITTWLLPFLWQACIALVAIVCAAFALAWRLRKQRRLYEDVSAGTTIIFDVEYSIQ